MLLFGAEFALGADPAATIAPQGVPPKDQGRTVSLKGMRNCGRHRLHL